MGELISPYIIAIGVAWMTAHVIKYMVSLYRRQRVGFVQQLFLSGGMPSSHTATAVAVWFLILMNEGPQSSIFGLATLVVLIFSYDAVKVRRSVGEQGTAIYELIKQSRNPKLFTPRSAKGHTPLEVIAGACLGLVIGAVVFFATN